ncbi:amino acid aminotransferase [Luteococcus japonicus]|uniref:Aminotransferase n=1 Tax=Luteococcus japonicus LSP_Lj1 TaxID=1255658 RepID=A0A1R4IBU0_9ACTN|nr:amino acid aminotransferase [Luteococcus japonicus]SJN17297.1 Aromatic-amino-acid aminotransferase [Luteococcus japonicus LSP_Lj1]
MATFDDVEFYPGDPIFGLTDMFNADDREQKVNLGVGIYLDEMGRLPLPQAVGVAEKRLAEQGASHNYIPMGGLPSFIPADQELVFGADAAVVAEGRIATVQTLGGSGALKEAADFLHVLMDANVVALSDPSWANHAAIFGGAGYDVVRYRYYDAANHRVDVDGMLADIRALQPGAVVVLHACCHNPTGYDLDAEQWVRVTEAVEQAGAIAFLDMAYQGFSRGLDEDRVAVDTFVASGQRFFVGNSFSKNFGLYGERIGGLSLVCRDADEARRVSSQLCKVVRANYSCPPAHGAQIVTTVLADAELRASWEAELAAMRDRIRAVREALTAGLHEAGVTDMDFVLDQNGMFSYSGLSAEQMQRLRTEHAVYGTDEGRICVAGLNEGNVGHVVKAIAAVVSR